MSTLLKIRRNIPDLGSCCSSSAWPKPSPCLGSFIQTLRVYQYFVSQKGRLPPYAESLRHSRHMLRLHPLQLLNVRARIMPKTSQRSNFPSRSITVKKRPRIPSTPTIEDSTDLVNRRHQPIRAVKSTQKTHETEEAPMSRPTMEHTRSTESVRRARSTSVPTATGRLTKTGRPSRATKGLPVHVCHLCGKVC